MTTRRIASLICSTLFLASAGAASAQTSGISWPSATIGFLIGPSFPIGVFRDSMDAGVGLGIVGQVPLAKQGLALRADVLYQSLGDHQKFCAGSACSSSGRRSRVLSVSADLIVSPVSPWPVSPYAIVGAAYNDPGDPSSTILTFNPSSFGVQAGVGLSVRRGREAVFVEARWMSVSPGALLPITFGMRF